MSICFVVPTMSRKYNGLDYFKTSLLKNKLIFNNNNLCIFINEKDLNKLKTELTDINYSVISRIEHTELNIFKKDSYSYWRSHLCADFMYCLSQAMKIKPKCDYYVWLEDDVLLHPNFDKIWTTRNNNFLWTANGHGATCLIFSKKVLNEIVIPSIKKYYLKDIPLDFMFKHFGNSTELSQKIAFHIGVTSSREDQIIRVNDWNQYNEIVKDLEIIKCDDNIINNQRIVKFNLLNRYKR